jgi:hypothetical protein
MDSVQGGAVSAEFAALSAALDCYLDSVRDGLAVRCSDADVLAEVRGFEALRRRLDSFELDVLPELDRRGLPGVLGARAGRSVACRPSSQSPPAEITAPPDPGP